MTKSTISSSTLLTQNPSRRRVQLSCPETSITDQTVLSDYSMASLKAKLEKHLPIHNLISDPFYSLKPLQYTNLQDALNFHQTVLENFQALPSALRIEMGNDIRNFEEFVSNPDNAPSLIKHGLMSKPDASNLDVVNSINSLKESFKNSSTSNPDPDSSKNTSPNKQK